ncbi:MAG: hypothetical protein HY542_05035 [Deltaproteobacteria bacterium]|nr:hypothetical protein [Deltaproteobacteria bacterium]
MIQVGLKIGADVPFFLAEGAQRVTGIGEILEPISVPSLPVVLINPGFPVSTADVYRWWDKQEKIPPGPPFSKGGSRLTEIKTDAIPPLLENDLEEVVISRYPVLAEVKETLVKAGALGALMSGSGGTVFGLFESVASRDRGFDLIVSKKDPDWWLWKGNARG